MHSLITTLLLLTCSQAVISVFLSPIYPPPSDLTSNQSLVPTAFQNFTSQLDALLSNTSEATSAIRNLTFSVNVFSVNDPTASEKFQYHYTGPQVRNSSYGTKEVNADSIYHVASVTKLFSVYTALLALTPEDWQTPLSQIFPEFAANVETVGSPPNPIYTTQWDKITPYMLASQMSDLPKDGPAPYSTSDILSQILYAQIAAGQDLSNTSTTLSVLGLPSVNINDPKIIPPCFFEVTNPSACTVDDWITALAWRDPSFPAFTEPNYSNTGFILFGATIARLTNKTLDELYNQYLFGPLGMDSSFIKFPGNDTLDRCVISGDYTLWTSDPGVEGWAAGSGFIMTSPNDLAKMGISIMNSTLLDPVETRRWLKPISHTSNLEYAVGMPWEISRYVSPDTGKITDLYPKSGDSGDWTAFMTVIPDFDVGFSVVATWTTTDPGAKTLAVSGIADLLVASLLPALEAQAAAEADQMFSGRYVSSDANVNSSVTIERNMTAGAVPGLVITEWISNGTDMIALPALGSVPGKPIVLQMTTDTRSGESGAGQVAFRRPEITTSAVEAETVQKGLFTKQWSVSEWYYTGGTVYAGVGLDLFVFDVAEGGRVISVSPAGLRITLEKEGE